MFRFKQTQHDIWVGPLSLKNIVQNTRTPFYLYDLDGLESHLSNLQEFMKQHPHILICYAVKANPDPEICKRMIHAGLGFDVVSGGEIQHLRRLGARTDTLFFSGVGKTIEEIDLAIRERIGTLHVESLSELDMICHLAKTLQQSVRVGIRWNPDAPVDTHPHLRTGASEDKFGLNTPQVFEALSLIQKHPELSLVGLHTHIGSQILDLGVFEKLFAQAKTFAKELTSTGLHLEYLNVGGGLGIYYNDRIGESLALLQSYLTLLADAFHTAPYHVVTELGRSVIALYGVLVSRVLYAKHGSQKHFLICDASMTELLRPALYGAQHPLWMIQQSKTPQPQTYEVVSPICESGDVFAKQFQCEHTPTYGDLMLILGAGAYGASMASQYNLRPLPSVKYIHNNQIAKALSY